VEFDEIKTKNVLFRHIVANAARGGECMLNISERTSWKAATWKAEKQL
jgi:hypothetical protein